MLREIDTLETLKLRVTTSQSCVNERSNRDGYELSGGKHYDEGWRYVGKHGRLHPEETRHIKNV